MNLSARRQTLRPAIPTATMADIAFLLIIFFMVTTAASLDHTPMDLPATVAQEQAAKGAAIIALGRDGALRFSSGDEESRPVADLAELAKKIRAVTAVDTRHPFLLKADQELPYRAVDRVLVELREAHARSITLLSRAEDGQ